MGRLDSRSSERMSRLRSEYKALRSKQNKLQAEIDRSEAKIQSFNELTRQIKAQALSEGRRAYRSKSRSERKSVSRKLSAIAKAISSKDVMRASEKLRY